MSVLCELVIRNLHSIYIDYRNPYSLFVIDAFYEEISNDERSISMGP